MREFVVGATFSTAVLLPFLVFVAAGWPGKADPCVADVRAPGGNSCYCESFNAADIGKPGVRQPANTWSNLYSLATGAFVGFMIWRNRRRGLAGGANRMRSTEIYPLLYLCVLIFLGLGSMWFHASLVGWAGSFDQLSMFAYSLFLVTYTLVRMLDRDWPMYTLYPAAVVLLTLLGMFGVPSFLLIVITVAVYLGLEAWIWFGLGELKVNTRAVLFYWLPGVGAILAAVVIWILSQTGGALCAPDSALQGHAAWHLLAGVMAVLLYFYWRAAPR